MQLLLAPAGKGKTAHIIQRIMEVRAQEPLLPIWVIVSNKDQAQAFRRRLGRAGGALHVEIDTFAALYARVLAMAGKPAPRVFEAVQHRLLRMSVDTLCEEGSLTYYANLRDKPGFIRQLRSLILELKQARIEPEAFAKGVSGGSRRLSELAVIYDRYHDWLLKSGWADADGQGWLAEVALNNQPDLANKIRFLAVDGFDEFNPTQLAVLRLLAQRAGETVVTLTGAYDQEPREAHIRFLRARAELLKACPEFVVTSIDSLEEGMGSLPQLERALFRHEGAVSSDLKSNVFLVEARNRSEEVRAALRWLKRYIIRDGIAPQDTAIIARNLDPYRPHLHEIASEYGLPLYVLGGESLISNPAIAALLNLLSLPVSDWPQRQILDAWRSPYFDWAEVLIAGSGMFKTMEEGANRMAEAVRASKIISGQEQWREALARRAQVDETELRDLDDDRALLEGPVGEEAAALLRMFTVFTELLPKTDQSLPLSEFIARIEGMIGPDPQMLGANETDAIDDSLGKGDITGDREVRGELWVVAQARANATTADRDVVALQSLKDVLRGLLLAEEITAGLGGQTSAQPITYQRFYSEMRGAVEATSYRLPKPPVGTILATTVIQARGISFEAVAILGLSEGEFPNQEREDPLLWDQEREALRERDILVPAPNLGEQVTLFYEAITRARRFLFLSRPYLSEDGRPWEPSPYWQEILRLVALEPARAEIGVDPASATEYLAVSRAFPEPVPGELRSLWKHIERSADIFTARQLQPAAGLHNGDLSVMADHLQKRFSLERSWSSSRLESYAVCPYQFYMRTGLELDPRPEVGEGFDAMILGSIYHTILEEIYRIARDQGDWSLEALTNLLAEVASPIFEAAPRRYGFRPTALWSHQQREMKQKLMANLRALSDMATSFTPLVTEAAFGLQGQPLLEIRSEEGTMRLRGYIDRVDIDHHGRLQIIDYKTGSTAITPADLAEGKRIQLPLYALAAEQALSLGQVTQGYYWHLSTAKPSTLKLADYPDGVNGATDVAVDAAFKHLRGIRSGRYEPTPPGRGCPPSCPATAFCWQYRKGY